MDAATFAQWGVGYLKVDFCGVGSPVPAEPAGQYRAWAQLRDALNATGRPIYYSICPRTGTPRGGEYRGRSVYAPPPAWTVEERRALANSVLVEYVNTFDAWYADPIPAGDGGAMDEPGGIITNIDAMVRMTWFNASAPGSFNDPDMLQMCTFGEGATRGHGMTLAEYTAHWAVWAIFGGPLIHGADPRTVGRKHPECLRLMLNPEVIAVNQDPLVAPARLVRQRANSTVVNSTTIVEQVFVRPLSGGRLAAVLLNRGERTAAMRVPFAELGWRAPAAQVRDVLARRDLPPASGAIAASVGRHSVAFVVLA